MSKLESIDSRVQACEYHLGHPSRTSPIPPPSLDPKGKVPMVSHRTSPIPSPTPHIPSPHTSSSAQKSPPPDPVPIPSGSSHSSSTSHSDPQQFELAAHSPITPAVPSPVHSQDYEATPSDLIRFIVTPPPSPSLAITPSTCTKQGASKNPSYTPSPTQPSQPSPSTQITPIPYVRRKLVVSRPGTLLPLPPPPPQS